MYPSLIKLIRKARRHANKGLHDAWSVSWNSWINGHSYRVVNNIVRFDKLAMLRYYYRAANKILGRAEKGVRIQTAVPANGVGAYYQDDWQSQHYLPYLNRLAHQKISVVFLRDQFAAKTNPFDKLMLLLSITGMMIRYLPEFTRAENKGRVGLRLLQFAENALLVRLLSRHKINYVYMFGAFENDGNMTALFLNAAGIKLHKIPSSTPLKNFYKRVVADGFSFTSPFQTEEYEQMKKNWFVKETMVWPVFNYVPLLGYLYHLKPVPPAHTIGLLARGMWRRKERGDPHVYYGEDTSEYETIRVIRDFALKHKDVQVIVFTHPIERKTPEIFEKAKRFYTKAFDGISVQIPMTELGSFELFHTVDIAVASISSSNIERLFCGYKTFYSPIGLDADLFGSTGINKIVCKTEEKLMASLEESLNMTPEMFFEHYHLQGYHYKAYKQWIN